MLKQGNQLERQLKMQIHLQMPRSLSGRRSKRRQRQHNCSTLLGHSEHLRNTCISIHSPNCICIFHVLAPSGGGRSCLWRHKPPRLKYSTWATLHCGSSPDPAALPALPALPCLACLSSSCPWHPCELCCKVNAKSTNIFNSLAP